MLEAQFRLLGATPQVMAFSEVYQALQTGVVDGQENTPSNMYTQKMHEVQKYTTLTNHGYIGYVVVVNKKFWDGLPADIRDQLDKAMEESTAYANKISASENDEALAEIKKIGQDQFIVPTAAEMAAMQKAMEPLYEDMGQPRRQAADRRRPQDGAGRDQLTKRRRALAVSAGARFHSRGGNSRRRQDVGGSVGRRLLNNRESPAAGTYTRPKRMRGIVFLRILDRLEEIHHRDPDRGRRRC